MLGALGKLIGRMTAMADQMKSLAATQASNAAQDGMNANNEIDSLGTQVQMNEIQKQARENAISNQKVKNQDAQTARYAAGSDRMNNMV